MDKDTLVGDEKLCGRLKEVLDWFERGTERDTGVKMISGGFAIAELDDVNDDTCLVTLKWGVQSDCENRVNTEEWELPVSALMAEPFNALEALEEMRS